MSFSLSEDFKTVEEFGEAPDLLLEQARQTGRPLVITTQGEPTAVLLSAEVYERMVHTEQLTRLLKEGMDDVRAGRTAPLEDFLTEFKRAKKISRQDSRKRSGDATR